MILDILELPEVARYKFAVEEIVQCSVKDPRGRIEVAEDQCGVPFVRATYGHAPGVDVLCVCLKILIL